jgi:signal transduction histidine kinase
MNASQSFGASSADQLLAPVRDMFAKLQRSTAVERGDLEEAIRQVTEAAAGALRVSRASVWQFGEDRSQIRCLDLFDRNSGAHSSGATLSASDTPRYFEALRSERTIAAHDAHRDSRTSEFAPSYLEPNGIAAMLDAPIWLSGKLVGVVCNEHVGDRPRAWAPWEELVAGTIADFASIILGAAERAAQARALERAALEREHLLDSVFQSAPFGLAFFNREIRYTRINDWLANLNGTTRAQTIGKRPLEIIRHPETAALSEQMIAQVFATGEKSKVIEVTSPHATPEPTFLIRFYPVIFDGHVDHVGCYVVEITSQRAVERERQELLDRERAAREEAEAASRAKDEFFSVLGHELRNPLAPISTALDLMRPLGPTAGRERAVIQRQVAHLGRLVDDMLDVARITRGKIELRTKPVEIVSVVEKGIEMASPLLDRNGHTLVVDVPSTGLRVEADPDRLAQVISNLLANAAKFTPSGGRVEVRAYLDSRDVVLEVRDNGVGFPRELEPKIFDAFVQGERRVDNSQGGLGLGLAIVHGIILAHCGSVTGKSDGVGKGSVFTVRLPSLSLSQFDSLGYDDEVTPPPPSSRRRVLVVDDNEDAALMLALALKSNGHEVMTAFDGPTALATAAQFHPEAALLDLGLPVMDGFELARRLRELPGGAPMKIVAVTGYSSAKDRERSAEAQFDSHLVKPIDTFALEQLFTDLFAAP